MFSIVIRILLKLLELIGCIACLIIKNLTDAKARRIYVRNQKFSREWSLLNNVTWSREGNAFASVAYGGYTLITALFLLSRCAQPKGRSNLTEKFFLAVGMIFFFVIGSIVYASIEQIPSDLYDNAIILGTLSYIIALLFLIDMADPIPRKKNSVTQTDIHNVEQEIPKSIKKNMFSDSVSYNSDEQNSNNLNGTHFPGDQVDIIQTKILPVPQQPVFQNILIPEKKRATKQKIPEPSKLHKNQEVIINKNTDLLKELDQIENVNYCLDKEPIYRSDARSFHIMPNKNSNRVNNQIEENFGHCTSPGFVNQAAKMWDRRSRHCAGNKTVTKYKLNTVV